MTPLVHDPNKTTANCALLVKATLAFASAPFIDGDAFHVSHPAVVPVEIIGRAGYQDVDLLGTPEMGRRLARTLVQPIRQLVHSIVALFLHVVGHSRAEDGDASEESVLIVQNI